MLDEKPIVIGVGGFARSGKDTFVKIARKILKEHGYSSIKLAFADTLKDEIDGFLKSNYNISAWTNDDDEKMVIRPFLVAHGCGKRGITGGKYWIEKLDQLIEGIHFNEDVIFVSDCRFPNEVDWVHQKWSGWFVHVKKYRLLEKYTGIMYSPETERVYDDAPNEEEATNDPICERRADYRLEMENAIEREARLTGKKISPDSLADNTYLNEEILTCLKKCPLLTLE